MIRIFLSLYDFFHRRKTAFRVTFISILILLGAGAYQIKIEEDITRFFPDDKNVEDLNYVFQNSKFVEQLVIMVSMRDSTSSPQPDSLVLVAESLVSQIDADLKPYVTKITSHVDDEKILNVFSSVYDHLPVFLNDKDYVELDSVLTPENIRTTLQNNYNQLISPIGMGVKRIILQDPLGFCFLALRKLNDIQYDRNFELYDGYIITKDHRHVIFFITPRYPPNETGNNIEFIAGLNTIVHTVSDNNPLIKPSFFGASAVAVGNAVQLRRDTVLTVSIMVIILAVFLLGFFKRKRIPFLIAIPIAFGALFSLCMIFLIKGSVSILALAAGSMILGIAVNYALHFLAHLKHVQNVRQVIEDLVNPMTLGNMTTVLAFFCLQFTNAAVLRDVGLFAGFSLVGAAICSLVFLPHFISDSLFDGEHSKETWIEKIPFAKWADRRYVVLVIFLLTPLFFYFASKVSFDADMNNLNFMNEETHESQQRVEAINHSTLNTIFAISHGGDLETALRKNERMLPVLTSLKAEGHINKYSSVSSFLISDSLQQRRIEKWNSFWTEERTSNVQKIILAEGAKLRFSAAVLDNFDSLIARQYKVMSVDKRDVIQKSFFDEYIISKDTSTTIITLVNVEPSKKVGVSDQLQKISVKTFDRQMMANLFVKYVNADFNFIVLFTGILVFLFLLMSYGRIELTLITFAPMFITWIWILGIMAIIGIQFNIVNVMVSTFIFGLGDDYSIFIMDGLQQEFKTGKKILPSIRTSIFLSAFTTVAGLGVLIFAKHPAMKSIAAISIIGIVCVFVMSQTIEPYLFRALISNRTQKGLPPRTMLGMFYSFVTYFLFIVGALILTVVGLVFQIIPFGKKKLKLAFHWLLSVVTWIIIYLQPHLKKKFINLNKKTFSQPSVVIANHSSIVDILLMILLYPKLILLTNQWVWHSPIMGGVVRLADYYPVGEGVEDSVELLRARAKEGYSIVVFPEGTRSPDQTIRRFHKGAFYLAEILSLPIQPLLIHGAGYAVPKGTFYLNPGQFTLKFLDPISNQTKDFGATYAERAKGISRYFKTQYAALATEIETPAYFYRRLISNYLYKGPVLEWYLRVKLNLEDNYTPFYNMLPRSGIILDLGCGYGFLCYMLHLRSKDQKIVGVDYDAEKIETAIHSYLKSETIEFHLANIQQFPLAEYLGIVLSDVLHYMELAEQRDLLSRCCNALLPGGIMIIRDGNSESKQRHKRTQLSEFFSINLLQFNKSSNTLNFLPTDQIKQLVENKGLTFEINDNSTVTSNVMIVVRKNS
ncbi:MMPL family transporter [soil metagenome]